MQPGSKRSFRNLPYDGSVCRIDPQTGKVIDRLACGLQFTNGIAFGPSGAFYFNETLTGTVYHIADDGAVGAYTNVTR